MLGNHVILTGWLRTYPVRMLAPANTDIPEYLAAISRGDFRRAYQINLVDNVFPAILGRVCSRPCEPVCRHGWEGLGEPVAICFSKRSSADFINQEPIVLPPLFSSTGKKVAIIGSGVAGLAAARNLALYGHAATVFEKRSYPGGMLNQGIPVFRLPREIINKEIKQIELTGVQIACNMEIGRNLALDSLVRDYDAVILAGGTLYPNILDLPGKNLKGIRHGLDFLLETNESGKGNIGEEVVVIGGGFTAMDCARTALRLNVNSVKVYYRRSREEILVNEEELVELENEGIPIQYMVSPAGYYNVTNDKVESVSLVRTKLGELDPSGRRRPIEIPNSKFGVKASSVLLATGQFPDTKWIDQGYKNQLVGEDNWLISGKSTKTAHQKIFAAGDFALGATTLIDAIGHAKKCARDVDTFLMGEERFTDVAFIENATQTGRNPEANSIQRHSIPTIPLKERTLTAEVETGYDKKESKQEALRCYLCHFKYEIDNDLCIYCDGCLRVMPVDNCIVKVSALAYDKEDKIVGYNPSKNSMDYNLLYIDQNECIRCGACADVCPVDCIPLQKVSKKTIKVEDVYTEMVNTDQLRVDPL